MCQSNKISVRQLLKSLRNARFFHAFTACWMGASFSALLISPALSADRNTPLQIQIPSVPANIPSVDVVDNNLPVHLLDAQVEEIRHAQPPPQAPPVASGQFVLGDVPTTTRTKRHTNNNTTSLPAVIMTGARKAVANQPFVQPAQIQPSQVPTSPPPINRAAATQPYSQQAIAVGSTGGERKSFLNRFAMQQPEYLSKAEASKLQNYQAPVARRHDNAPIIANGKSRITAVMPEAVPVALPAQTVAERQMLPVNNIDRDQDVMRRSSAVRTVPFGQASVSEIPARAQPQQIQQIQQVPQIQEAQQMQRAPVPQSELDKLSQLSASLADSSKSLERSLATMDAPSGAVGNITRLPTLEEAKQAFAEQEPAFAQSDKTMAAYEAAAAPAPQVISRNAAVPQNAVRQPIEQVAALPTLEEAKQAFANPVGARAGEVPLRRQENFTETSASVAQAPVATQVAPAPAEVAEAVESPMDVLPSRQVVQQITKLPSLEQAKQAFGKDEISPSALATQTALETAVDVTGYDAKALGAIEPAAGADNTQINQLTASTAAPVRSGLVLEEVGAQVASTTETSSLNERGYQAAKAVDLKPLQRIPDDEMLSFESKRMLDRVPTKLDSPKNTKQQRVDIERAKVTASVFSELDGRSDGLDADEPPPMTMTVDVQHAAIDVNYELERAYSALGAGQSEIAKESYMRVLSVEPKNIQALFGMGALMHRVGALDAAREYYAQVLKQDPDNRDTLNNFLSLVAEEAPEQALFKLKELESKNPDFSPIPAQISFIYQKLQNIQMAGQYMVKALALAPNNLTYKYNLAILLDKQGARQDAANFYQDLVDAYLRGESIPGNIASIQERLTFIRSNRWDAK